MVSVDEPLGDRCQLPPVTSMAVVERATAQPFPTGCLVKPVAPRRDFSGSGGIFLLLGPPSSAWAVSVSLRGTRLGDRASTQRFSNPLAGCKSLISKAHELGCVRSVLGARVRLSGRSHV